MVIFIKTDNVLPLTEWSWTESPGSGRDGSKHFKLWHGRDLNFSRGKSRILITFKGMEGILS
jgi:hypothetical protein